MAEDIKGTGSRGYNTQISSLADNADIVTAFKVYHYGTASDGDAVAAESIAGWLDTRVDKNLINARGDILVGSADNVVVRLPAPTQDDQVLVSKISQSSITYPSGLTWIQADYEENHTRYIMGYYT